jgi:hypothetical protein
LAHLNQVPSNGTFIRDPASGGIWEVAGGAPIGVSTCANLGGCAGVVNIDPYAVAHLDHLNARPADGTVVEGLPSRQYWSFAGGLRSPASPSSAAIGVDDAGLAAFPQRAPPVIVPASAGRGTLSSSAPPGSKPPGSRAITRCVVPHLRGMTMAAARRALARAHCRMGKVSRPRHPRRGHVLSVVAQSARSASHHPRNYRVNITLR